MHQDYPEIVIGDILLSNVRPWKFFPTLVTSVIVNSYELITKKGLLWRIRKKGGLRAFLEIQSDKVLWIDSGGYQIMQRGLNISVEKILSVYRIIDADIFVSLDHPTLPGDNSFEREKKIKKSLKNFEYLTNKLPDKKIIPVVHFSPTLDDYDRLLKIYLDTYGCDTIAFGGFVPPLLSVRGTKKARLKAILALRYVALMAGEENIHVMGVGATTTISILNALRIKSADSAAWRIKAAYGKIMLPWGGERHVTNRDVSFGKKKLTHEELRELADFIRLTGNFPFDSVCKDLEKFLLENIFQKFEGRALFNAWVVLSLAKKTPPKSGSFRSLYQLALHIKKLDQDDIRKLWGKLNDIKQGDLMKYVEKLA